MKRRPNIRFGFKTQLSQMPEIPESAGASNNPALGYTFCIRTLLLILACCILLLHSLKITSKCELQDGIQPPWWHERSDCSHPGGYK